MTFQLTPGQPPDDASLAAKFATFDAAHPEVWALFKRFAFEAIAAGYTRMSARMIIYRIRWETSIAPTGGMLNPDTGKPIKINNNWSPYYARKFATEYPWYFDFFAMRSVGDSR